MAAAAKLNKANFGNNWSILINLKSHCINIISHNNNGIFYLNLKENNYPQVVVKWQRKEKEKERKWDREKIKRGKWEREKKSKKEKMREKKMRKWERKTLWSREKEKMRKRTKWERHCEVEKKRMKENEIEK